MGDNHKFVPVQKLVQAASQYISVYIQVVTSTTASSVQAAGIQIGLPAEVGRLIAFLQQLSRAVGEGRSVTKGRAVEQGRAVQQGRAILKQFLSPFLLDNWQCLGLSEAST